MTPSKSNIAISTTVWVSLILICLQLIWKFPKPLFFFVMGTFLFLSAAYWYLMRDSRASGAQKSYQLILIWIIATCSILTVVYKVDRAGWNWQRLTGYNVTLAERHFDLVDASSTLFLQRYPFFEVDDADPTRLILRKGVHDISETVIVPRHHLLYIEPGATLQFEAGRSLISYSPVYAQGTKAEPIIFMAKNKLFKWGAVGVLKAEKSIFENVIFRHSRHSRVNDVDFLAGLSIIQTDVEIRSCKFVNSFGKDALNVQRANVLITNNLFKNSQRDGLDLDTASGEVSSNQFINCKDEGIDLSENFELNVFNNYVFDSRGGKISAENNITEILSLNKLGYLKNQ